ncbi:MAG: helix-hairpin-helix domain-containing protein [Blastocatellia bacterium]
MRMRSARLVIITVFVLTVAGLALQSPATPAYAARAGRDDGAALLQKLCGNCHALDRVTASRRSRAQWEETTDKMITAGAKGSDEEFTAVLNYLVSRHGRVNVNNAPVSEITEATGLSDAEAEAIVRYRKDKGKIEDFEALAKIPGLAAEKLEKARDAISF